MNVKIDKKRKIPVTVLLRAFGYESDADILDMFKGEDEIITKHIAPTLEKDKTKTRLEALYAIYKQVIDVAEVSFEGEPLNGLQIMGVLESRVLDFETVIITSMNEGKFPAGKSMNSFIPFDV